MDVLVLLPIRKMVRITWLDKARRTDGVSGSGVYGNTRVDGVSKLFSGEISSSFDLAAWQRFVEIGRGEMERRVRGSL
jgi:hypothetical protein